jgi:hypothetical protein
MNTVVQLWPSQSEKPTVRGGRSKNTDYRQREYLTEAEVAKLVDTAGAAARCWLRPSGSWSRYKDIAGLHGPSLDCEHGHLYCGSRQTRNIWGK